MRMPILIAICVCVFYRELSWVKIYNVDHRYEANKIEGTCIYLYIYIIQIVYCVYEK